MNIKVPLTLAEHHSDIKIKNCCTQKPLVTRFCMFCAYDRHRYQVSIYRTIGPLVFSYCPLKTLPLQFC